MKIQKAKVIGKQWNPLQQGEVVIIRLNSERVLCIDKDGYGESISNSEALEALQFINLIDWEVIKNEWESIGWIEKNTEDTFHWFKDQITKQL